eukprot:CAMPEP_0117454384 /NCGR_PEP_ID=MMETSP0759-20121206/10768_1 /TAXON_ID=63605 /ORGANISM="Percolomonas cosmopolitus, Strain WS" /LENGTH=516 /DNA_ID=CAMNT_0005247559 /DNA_START=191 /DNA_END=1742 /DNA_ORIENTATION=-
MRNVRELRMWVKRAKAEHMHGVMDKEHMKTARLHLEGILEELERNAREKGTEITEKDEQHNVPKIYHELKRSLSDVSLPKTHLLRLVKGQVAKHKRRSVQREHRMLVKEYLTNLPRTNSGPGIKDICDDLQTTVTLPRQVLYDLIALEMDKLNRQRVTAHQKLIVREFLVNTKNSSLTQKDINAMCQELEQQHPHLNLPRKTLYELVRVELDRTDKLLVTNQDRSLIQSYIRHTENNEDLVKMCDDLQSQLKHLTRRVVYSLVHEELSKMNVGVVVEEQRERVRKFLDDQLSQGNVNFKTLSVSTLADHLQSQLADLPRTALRTVIQQEVDKLKRRLITEDHCAHVRRHLQKSNHIEIKSDIEPDIGSICNALQSEMSDLPRSALYHVVRRELERHMRKLATEEDRLAVREFVEMQVRGHESAPSHQELVRHLCGTLQPQLAHLPKRVIYFLVRREVLKNLQSAESSVRICVSKTHALLKNDSDLLLMASSIRGDTTSRWKDPRLGFGEDLSSTDE